MSFLKSLFQVFRAQTLSATLLLIVVPFVLGGGTIFGSVGICLVLFSLCIHYFSFGQNSLQDLPFDRKDPNKQHHPLVDGTVSEYLANNVIHWGLALTAVFGLVIVVFMGRNPLPALGCLMMFWIWGHAYNDGLSKYSYLSFIPISLCFTFLSGMGLFISINVNDTRTMLMGGYFLVYISTTICFQISVEGCMKEIDSTEKNLLHKLGVLPWESTDPRDPKGRYNSGYLYYFGFWLKLLSIVVAFLMAFTYSGNTRVIFVGVVVLFGIVMFALNRKITTEIDINERGKMIRNFGLMEIASIYLPCILIINGTNWPDITVLLVGAIVYFMLMNRWLWNTWVAPRV